MLRNGQNSFNFISFLPTQSFWKNLTGYLLIRFFQNDGGE
jgi:hypothetical protein